MERRSLGRSGARLSILGLGGGRVGLTRPERKEAIALIHRALDLGVNYIDTATSYGDGESESRIGEVMRSRRQEVFLAAKVDARTRSEAVREIRESLVRLQTDSVDLLQLHSINDAETLDQVMARDGSFAALEGAQKAGFARLLGITGHKEPQVLATALERYDFDSVLMPVGCQETLYGDFLSVVGPLASAKGVGVLGIKVMGQGILGSKAALALRYVLSLPLTAVVVGMGSLGELEENVRVAEAHSPLSAEEREELLAIASEGKEAMWWRLGRRRA